MALPPIVKKIALSPKQSTNEAFESILRVNFDSMLNWAPIAYHRKHIEGVHQVRVSLRRLRSAVSTFRKAIPREITDPWNEEMRWVAGSFGPARDLDVFIDEGLGSMAGKLPMQGGEPKLLDLATKHQDEAYQAIQVMMDDARYQNFVTKFPQWVQDRGWFHAEMPAETRENLGKSIVDYARKVLGKRLAVVLLTGDKLETMPEVELHQLRIECKKLRYATEFFESLFDPTAMANFTVQLKGVQELLGVMNDVAVMPGLLQKILDGVQDAETLQYAGVLLGWRCHQAADIRKQLVMPWKTLSNTASPWRKK